MTCEIKREPFNVEVFAEIMPLGQQCWQESTIAKADTCAYYGERDFQIEPDLEQYQILSDQGILVLITLRDQGTLQGYITGISYRSLHHKRIRCAVGDSVYVAPEYRAYVGVMAEIFERELREMGVDIIGWPTHVNGPVYQVLKARGYVGDDIVMEKRLCVS